MSFALSRRKHIEDELSKIVRRQLRKSARALSASRDGGFGSTVHESRKSVKKVRAVAAVLEAAGAPLPRKDHKRLKAAAGALSRPRDSAAIIDTFDRIRQRYPKQLAEHTYGILRRGLVSARDWQEASAQREGMPDGVAERLEQIRKSVKQWPSPSIDLSAMIDVVAASYRRSRKAMKRARAMGQSATVHRWRKSVKRLWYQLRLVTPLMPGVASLVADLERLETELGDDHNLVILGATLRACHDVQPLRNQMRQIERLAVRMRQSRRKRAFALGRRIHARKPKAFARWLRAAAKQEGRQQQTAAASAS